MIGRVVSTKMQKTVVVLVESSKTHPLYKKTYKWSKRYMVDDPIGVKEGDLVEIEKIKPISKKKHWGVMKKVGTDFVAIATEQLKEDAAEVIAEVMPEEKESKQDTGDSEQEEKTEEQKEKEPKKKVEKVKEEKPKKVKAVKKEVKEKK